MTGGTFQLIKNLETTVARGMGMSEDLRKGLRYVLVTAAYNEQSNIEKTIQSVLAQSVPPEVWVVVSDGSTDKTDEIVQHYAKGCGFMRFVRVERAPGRSFGSKVRALHRGSELLVGVEYEFIGNLDADVSVAPEYFETLIRRFVEQPALGISGGFVCEEMNGAFRDRRLNRVSAVAHAGQLVRRSCYEAIGGYAVLEYGGEDWHAQTSARMRGWETQAFPDLKIFHHRHTGEADSLLRYQFREGRLDYSFGSDVIFELVKCARKVVEPPFLFGSIFRLAGFAWSAVCRERRPVSEEFVSFIRREQRERMMSLFKTVSSSALMNRRVEN